jgi:hypothetical protein
LYTHKELWGRKERLSDGVPSQNDAVTEWREHTDGRYARSFKA